MKKRTNSDIIRKIISDLKEKKITLDQVEEVLKKEALNVASNAEFRRLASFIENIIGKED